jgi:hypothetical protein
MTVAGSDVKGLDTLQSVLAEINDMERNAFVRRYNKKKKSHKVLAILVSRK